MRIIGEIPHPRLKISIFKSDNKLAVKFESGLLEQTYKFRMEYPTETVDDIIKVVDENLIQEVEKILETMQEIRMKAFLTHFYETTKEEFPVII